MTNESAILKPANENGKSVTTSASGNVVALFIWKKNGGIHVPITLTPAEAFKLADMLRDAASATA